MKVVIAQTGSASCIARDWNVTGSQGNASGCVIKNVWRPREVSLSHLLLLCPWETSASRESLQWTIHVWYPSLAQVVKLIFKRSLREKPTFRDTTTSFHAKWFLTNERRNSILMTCHYPDLGKLLIGPAAWEICSFRGETSGGVAKCWLLSQAMATTDGSNCQILSS